MGCFCCPSSPTSWRLSRCHRQARVVPAGPCLLRPGRGEAVMLIGSASVRRIADAATPCITASTTSPTAPSSAPSRTRMNSPRCITITCEHCGARRDWLLLNVHRQVFVRAAAPTSGTSPISRPATSTVRTAGPNGSGTTLTRCTGPRLRWPLPRYLPRWNRSDLRQGRHQAGGGPAPRMSRCGRIS